MSRLACVLAVALCACSKAPSWPVDPVGPSPSAGPSPSDGGTANTTTTGTLLETGIAQLQSVSPDGRRVLVSRKGSVSWGDGLVLATRGEASVEMSPQGAWTTGFFTADGTSIVFAVGDPGTAIGPSISLAHADGSAARLLAARSSFRLQQRGWLYYSDDSDGGTSLYRVALPDGAPELIDRHSGTYDVYQPVFATVSPTTDSIAYYFETSATEQPRLLPAGSRTPIALPALPSGMWAPDGAWLILQGCQVTDMQGRVRPLCDSNGNVAALSSDGSVALAAVSTPNGPQLHVISTATGADTTLPPLPAVDWSVFRPRFELGLTPDGSRVVAIAAHASFSISSAGGASWTMISADHGAVGMSESDWVRISPDSRIIVDASLATGTLVESIDGGAPVALPHFEGGPVFEPPGGLGKAIFFDGSYDTRAAWIGRADGTGSSRLGQFVYCEWANRTAICTAMHDDSNSVVSSDLVAITDDGAQRATVATNAVHWTVQGRTLFYVDSAGRLYAVDDLPTP